MVWHCALFFGVGVYGVGFMVWGLWCGVYGVGVYGVGFMVWGFMVWGFMVWGFLWGVFVGVLFVYLFGSRTSLGENQHHEKELTSQWRNVISIISENQGHGEKSMV